MTDFEAAQGYVNCGDTILALDLEAYPGLYGRAVQRLHEMNAQEAAKVRANGEEPSIFTIQDVTQMILAETFTLPEQRVA